MTGIPTLRRHRAGGKQPAMGGPMVAAAAATGVPGRRSARRSAGVTLVEVVVASSLLAIAIVPILKALSTATLTATKLEWKTQSLALAQAKLEEVKARSIYHYDDWFAEDSTLLEGSYRCTVSDDRHVSLRLVSVSVGCDANLDGSLASSEVEVTLTTYIARRI
jgi:Tfp pilus assembly protein PilV